MNRKLSVFSVLFLLVCLMPFASVSAQQKVDFSGKWKLNREESQKASKGRPPLPRSIEIIQDKEAITITKSEQGKTIKSIYAFDKESTNPTGDIHNTKIITTLNWSADGHELIFSNATVYSNGSPSGRETSETWKIQDNKIYVEILSGSGVNLYKSIEIFDKE